MSAARTLLGLDARGRAIRAARALRSRTTAEKTPDDVWPVGEIKTLGGPESCEHEWAGDQVFPEFVLRGCSKCPAIMRVKGVPDLNDVDAVEDWLNS